MKVLWFSNTILRAKAKNSGTWLYAMADSLIKNNIELYNISLGSTSRSIEEVNEFGIKQWALPSCKLRNDLPPKEIIDGILHIVEMIGPDMIHIWGMEHYWGLLYTRGYLKGKVLLDIQGIRAACAEVDYGGLDFSELIQCFGIREILQPQNALTSEKRRHIQWEKCEKEMLSKFKHISTQSEWVRARIRPYINEDTHIYKTICSVRREFLVSEKWVLDKSIEPSIITVSAGPSPLKGVHFIIKAVALLKPKFPDIKLKIVGNFYHNAPFWKVYGYCKYLRKLIKKLGLENNVIFTGQLNASEIVNEMKKSSIFVQSSFIESYSLSLAEAMALGMPCVVSYTGAMTELAKHGETALFYSPRDYHICADNIRKIIEDDELALSLSNNASRIGRKRNDTTLVSNIQLDIYNQILNSK